jgi:hypothetical protein
LFKRRLVLDEVKVVVHSDDMDAPVGLLQILKWHTEAKGSSSSSSSGSAVFDVDEEDYAYASERGFVGASGGGAAAAAAAAASAASAAEEEAVAQLDDAGDGRSSEAAAGEVVAVHGSSDQLLVSGITTLPWFGLPAGSALPLEYAVEEAAACAQMVAVLRSMSQAIGDRQKEGLSRCGNPLSDVCFVHLYLKDIRHFAAVNKE